MFGFTFKGAREFHDLESASFDREADFFNRPLLTPTLFIGPKSYRRIAVDTRNSRNSCDNHLKTMKPTFDQQGLISGLGLQGSKILRLE